jgi:hypothetical protein
MQGMNYGKLNYTNGRKRTASYWLNRLQELNIRRLISICEKIVYDYAHYRRIIEPMSVMCLYIDHKWVR